ncbi:MAG TPA: methylated-DNA--[protein]-cysteine S-methyltransferase [Clostridia bacterium]|nr:methylated-DNA--[protein]-cysteine S-methyltransferase [Clostridia bacterium]
MGNIFYYETPIGEIAIGEQDGAITHVLYKDHSLPEEYIVEETPILKEANRQLQEYFAGKRKDFSLDLNPSGTPFMKSVWTSLQNIPYGETRSYKDIAISVERDKAYRAVGLANNRNPISIFIPCHRVIGSNGALIGYGGGLDIKTFLLELENTNKASA